MKNEPPTTTTPDATDPPRALTRAFSACEHLLSCVRLASKALRSLLATPSASATQRLDAAIEDVSEAKAEALDALSCLDSSMRPDVATAAMYQIDPDAHGGTIASALETTVIGQRAKMSAAAKRMLSAYKAVC